MTRIDWKHLDKHQITLKEYKRKYGIDSTISQKYREHLVQQMQKINIALGDKDDKFTSKAETEIKDFIKSLNIECRKDRTILEGKELDIFIPSHNLAIEFNGNAWHSEEFGHKSKDYHINKLNECNIKGIRLIQIFEDEYKYHKNIVLDRIRAMLGVINNKPSIISNDCVILEIDENTANEFLVLNHIAEGYKSDIYIGCNYNDELIGAFTLTKKENDEWEINRIALSVKYRCIGLISKMFNYFIAKYKPHKIKGFADRRWTIDENNNQYSVLGFKLKGITNPDYAYFIPKLDRYKRYDKNDKLIKYIKNDNIKIYKIWDCGQYQYEWHKEEQT